MSRSLLTRAIKAQIERATPPMGQLKATWKGNLPTSGSILHTALHKAVSQQKISAYQAFNSKPSALSPRRIPFNVWNLLQSLKPSVARDSQVFPTLSGIHWHFFTIEKGMRCRGREQAGEPYGHSSNVTHWRRSIPSKRTSPLQKTFLLEGLSLE